jgi:hypothetical protein
MTGEALLRRALVSLEADDTFSEAVLLLRDDSRLRFCHRVGERWAKAERADGSEAGGTLAAEVLATMAMFRLNARHLDVRFQDGSRWEARFRAPPGRSY